MQLPITQTLSLLVTKWKSIIDPLLANPSNNVSILFGVKLSAGVNTINHGLGQVLTGWRIIGINGVSSIYDQQATNIFPKLTLVLNSSAAVTVNLEVF